MQVVEHDGFLFWSLFSLNAIVPGDSYHHSVCRAANDLTAVIAPSWTPPRWIAALQRAVVQQVMPILRVGPHSPSFVLFARSLTPRDRGRDPGPARASLSCFRRPRRRAPVSHHMSSKRPPRSYVAVIGFGMRSMREFASTDCYLSRSIDGISIMWISMVCAW